MEVSNGQEHLLLALGGRPAVSFSEKVHDDLTMIMYAFVLSGRDYYCALGVGVGTAFGR